MNRLSRDEAVLNKAAEGVEAILDKAAGGVEVVRDKAAGGVEEPIVEPSVEAILDSCTEQKESGL